MASSQDVASDGPETNYLDDEFTEWLDSWMTTKRVPGISIAVIDNGRVQAKGFGLAQLPDVPATADTVYAMASTTKAFSAAVMGMLIEDASSNRNNKHGSAASSQLAKKGWRTPVVKLLGTDFKTTSEYVTKTATIEDIVSHRSGIAGHDLIWGPRLGKSPAATTRCLRHLEATGDRFRQQWQYNNLMYGVLEHIVAETTQREFEAVLRERILEPLGMQDTRFGIERTLDAVNSGKLDKKRIARGYYWIPDEPVDDDGRGQHQAKKGAYVPDQYTSLTGVEPAGALVSTVTDYAKWVMMLLKASQPASVGKSDNESQEGKKDDEGQIISNALWQELTTPRFQIIPTPPASKITPPRSNDHLTPASYALGWFINMHMYPGEFIVTHEGGLPGLGTLVMLLPNHNFGLVLAGNTIAANAVGEAVAKELVGRKLGLGKEQRRRDPDVSSSESDQKSTTDDAGPKSEENPDVPTPTSGSEPSIDKSKVRLEGTYHHPAYGTVALSETSTSASLGEQHPNLEGRRIIRKKASDEQKTRTKSTGTPVLITPLEERALFYCLLAHRLKEQPYEDKLIYTMEKIESHGDLSRDPGKDLAIGYGSPDDKKCPGSQEKVWELVETREQAAVVELLDGGKGGEVTVGRLGLNMMRVDGAAKEKYSKMGEGEQRKLVEGWEGNMIWFHRVDC